MSSALAIAAVTEILVEQTKAALTADMGLADAKLVTVGPPQLMREGRRDAQLNLFLYQVAADAAWRNQDIPGQTKPGERAAPLLALRMGYLVTAFGEEDSDRLAHQMLGSVMLKFHNEPVLPRTSTTTVIADSQLARQYEPVRLTQQPMALDEMSKLWSGFQSPYRLSVAYEATAVLIDSGKPTHSAPPVLSRGDDKDAGFPAESLSGEPAIESLKFPPSQPGLRFGKLAVISGRNLDRGGLHLVFRHPRMTQGLVARPRAAVIRTTTEIRSIVPADWEVFREDPNAAASELITVTPDLQNWPAGVYTVSAGRLARPAVPADPLRLLSTDPVPFSLLPTIDIPVAGLTLAATLARGTVTSAQLAIKLIAPLHRATTNAGPGTGEVDQNLKLFAGDLELVGSMAFSPPDGQGLIREFLWKAAKPADVVGELRQRTAESLFVRIQVDGVDSSLLVPASVPVGQTEEVQERAFDKKLLLKLP